MQLCFNALEHMQRELVPLSSLCSLKQSSHFDREGGKTIWYLEDQKPLVQKKQNKAGWRARRRKELPNVTFLESQSRQSSPLHPTLALMMVGLGSKMPCIFLKAGMTKRLQVTTADTGFPGTKRWTQRGKGGRGREKQKETTMSNISAGASAWIPLSLNFTHYLGGQRLVCEHRPCPRWQMLWGDCKWRKKTLGEYHGRPPIVNIKWKCSVPLPWFHKNSTKMDLGVEINIQHLFKVVLKRKEALRRH